MDVDLELASFVDRRIEKSEKALSSGETAKRLAIQKSNLSMESE